MALECLGVAGCVPIPGAISAPAPPHPAPHGRYLNQFDCLLGKLRRIKKFQCYYVWISLVEYCSVDSAAAYNVYREKMTDRDTRLYFPNYHAVFSIFTHSQTFHKQHVAPSLFRLFFHQSIFISSIHICPSNFRYKKYLLGSNYFQFLTHNFLKEI